MFKIPATLLFIGAFFLSFAVNAQTQGDLKIYTEAGSDGDYIFYAENTLAKQTHIVIIFDNLSQHRADVSLPFQKSIRSGKTRLFKLSPIATAQPNWQYRSFFFKGVGNPRITDVEYALPAVEGESVDVRGVTRLKIPTDEVDLGEYYGVSFYADKVKVLRPGQIEVVKADEANPNKNYVRIRHKDGTLGVYSGIMAGTADLVLDDFVKVGDVLGAAVTEEDNRPFFNFSVSYMKVVVDSNGPINSKATSSARYLVPLFRTMAGERVRLDTRSSHSATFPDDLVTQEMSKREKKKYLKGKKG